MSTGSGTLNVYPHRIAGSTTTARHKELTDAALTNDGMYNVLGLAQRDQVQGHKFFAVNGDTSPDALTNSKSITVSKLGTYTLGGTVTVPTIGLTSNPITDGPNETPRTGPRTRPRSGVFNFYAYVGTYTE